MALNVLTRLLMALILVSGCSVGGKYGYDQKFVESPTGYKSVSSSGNTESMLSFVHPFLIKVLRECGGVPEEVSSGRNHAAYIVRKSRGCVSRGDPQWELIQLSFTLTGDNYQPILITTDGRLASSIQYPGTDSRFTKSMDSGSLAKFSQWLASEFRKYVSNHSR